MKTKKLGQASLQVSTLCLGGNVFGWTVDEATSFQLLDAYVAAGGNFIDTADVYSRWKPGNQGGESETIIGKWMKKRNNRSQIVVTTKVGAEMAPDQKGLSKSHILKSVEDSLRRLQTDYIDLYLSHRPDTSTSIDETLTTYDQLIKQGKVRLIGASNYSSEQIREAMQVSAKKSLPSYQVLQPLYNLYDREDFEQNLQPVCEKYGLGVTPFYGLASGFLTGKYRTQADLAQSARAARVADYLNDRGLRILKALDQVAAQHQTTPAAIALAWLMSRPVVTSAIASATSLEQMEDLVASTRIELNREAVELLSNCHVAVGHDLK